MNSLCNFNEMEYTKAVANVAITNQLDPGPASRLDSLLKVNWDMNLPADCSVDPRMVEAQYDSGTSCGAEMRTGKALMASPGVAKPSAPHKGGVELAEPAVPALDAGGPAMTGTFTYEDSRTGWESVRGSVMMSRRGSRNCFVIWLVNVPGVNRPAMLWAPV